MRLDVGCGANPRGDVNVDRRRSLQARDGTRLVVKADIIADVRKLPFRNETFEEVFSGYTIEHLDSPDVLLQECERVSSDKVTIVVPSRWRAGDSVDSFGKWNLEKDWFQARGYNTRTIATPWLDLRRLPGPGRVLRRILRPRETWAVKHKSHLYDFVFVLPGVNPGPAPGGYRVVYEIAKRLGSDGFSTAILFVPIDAFERYVNFEPFHKKIVNHYLPKLSRGPVQIFDPLQRQEGLLLALSSKEDFGKVQLMLSTDTDTIRTQRIFATHFTTAFYVNRYQGDAKKFYLIEHSEDDPSFSGGLSGFARRSYSLHLQKMVTNRKLYERFQSENPLFLKIGFASDFYKINSPIESRGKCVLFPLLKNPSKGATYGLEAMRLLKADIPDVRILTYGDWDGTHVPSFIDLHFGPSSEGYYGGPRNPRLLQLYNTAAVFMLPSMVEGFSLPTLEAMNCGCAAVVTNNGGVNEYVQDQTNGIMVPVANSLALKDAVHLLLTNHKVRMEMAQRGRDTASEFSFEKSYSHFLSIV